MPGSGVTSRKKKSDGLKEGTLDDDRFPILNPTILPLIRRLSKQAHGSNQTCLASEPYIPSPRPSSYHKRCFDDYYSSFDYSVKSPGASNDPVLVCRPCSVPPQVTKKVNAAYQSAGVETSPEESFRSGARELKNMLEKLAASNERRFDELMRNIQELADFIKEGLTKAQCRAVCDAGHKGGGQPSIQRVLDESSFISEQIIGDICHELAKQKDQGKSDTAVVHRSQEDLDVSDQEPIGQDEANTKTEVDPDASLRRMVGSDYLDDVNTGEPSSPALPITRGNISPKVAPSVAKILDLPPEESDDETKLEESPSTDEHTAVSDDDVTVIERKEIERVESVVETGPENLKVTTVVQYYDQKEDSVTSLKLVKQPQDEDNKPKQVVSKSNISVDRSKTLVKSNKGKNFSNVEPVVRRKSSGRIERFPQAYEESSSNLDLEEPLTERSIHLTPPDVCRCKPCKGTVLTICATKKLDQTAASNPSERKSFDASSRGRQFDSPGQFTSGRQQESRSKSRSPNTKTRNRTASEYSSAYSGNTGGLNSEARSDTRLMPKLSVFEEQGSIVVKTEPVHGRGFRMAIQQKYVLEEDLQSESEDSDESDRRVGAINEKIKQHHAKRA